MIGCPYPRARPKRFHLVSTPSHDAPEGLAFSVKASWQRFLDTYEPLRPELYRYCRHLTHSPWDAEDLAQDALARAFVTLAQLTSAPPNPRAWLLRVASNLWIDQLRRRQLSSGPGPEQLEAPDSPLARETREAAGTLLLRLSPQERAALVLKDVFDLTLEEVAEALSTSVGAVKAALHRGRGRILESERREASPDALAPAVLDAFCQAFNARDLARLTELLAGNAMIDVVGVTTEYGGEAAGSRVFQGMLYGSARLADAQARGGIEARFIRGVLPTPPRTELRLLRGEWLCLLWYAHVDGEAVRAINRVQVGEGAIVRLRNYFFTPDFIAEVCQELGVPCRVNGYRYWLSGC
jgi:RNA polymerase sigma-70 factor, ECF subfamily